MLDQLDIAIGFATVMLGVSLLITALTQALLSVLDTRGRNLRAGLTHLLKNVAPDLSGKADAIGEAIVRHPLVSDSATGRRFWGRATAITREELLPVLDQVLKTTGALPAGLSSLADEQRHAIDKWFDSTMSRTSQWFAMYSRWTTIALAIIVAFALHLDSAEVFRQLHQDREVRARMLALSGTLLEESPGMIAEVERVRDVYGDILRQLHETEPARFDEGSTLAARPASRTAAIKWLHANAASTDDAALLRESFTTQLDARLKDDLQRALDRFNSTRSDLDAAGLSLYPGDNHPWSDLWPPGGHFWGIAASVLLLSLGAPFWFNTLKNLSSLRTMVAQRAGPGGGTPPAPGRDVLPTPSGGHS